MREMDKLEDIEREFKYNSILFLKPSISLKHPRQSNYTRASQFAPFAALTGFSEQIADVGRTTSDEVFLAEERINDIDDILRVISKRIYNFKINVTYFVADKKKRGGLFRNKTGYIKRIDLDNKILIFSDKEKIKIQDIVNIEIK